MRPFRLFVLMLATAANVATAQIAVDGVFNDWNDLQTSIRDSRGDASGVFDITRVKAETIG